MSPRPRFEKLDPEKKEQILEAAADEFGARGFDAASINKIIEKAGISKGAAYYYFDDKSDMYVTVIEDAIFKIKAWVGGYDPEELNAENYWEKLGEYANRSMDFMIENPWAMRLFKSFWNYADTHAQDPAIQLLWKGARRFTRRFIERGQNLATIRTDIPTDLLVELLIGMGTGMDRWLFQHNEDLSPEELDEFGDVIIDTFQRILAPREEAS
jgi:AcrR family transcriptional regulator